AAAAVARASSAPLALHLDHVEDTALLHEAASHDFSSVMFDASTAPYDENVAATSAAVAWGHGRGLWVESELGAIGGKDGAHAPGVRTDPVQAAAFVEATGVDGLAVAVGSTHAMTSATARLDHEHIARLANALAPPLVLHGSSGVPEEELWKAVRHGIVKVNIGTGLNVAFTHAIRAGLGADGHVVDPRKYLAPARDAMAAYVARCLTALVGTSVEPDTGAASGRSPSAVTPG
ncbi:MAG: class II fructose-bisphosphate aldolase, partial [Kineosporiaceae bacterium]